MSIIGRSGQTTITDLSLPGPAKFLFPSRLSDESSNALVQYTESLSEFSKAHAGHPLTHLTIPGYAAWEIPTAALRHLTHLGIRQASGLNKVTLLFDHCVRLESLWISSWGGDDPAEAPALLSALAARPDALPHLTHLKLSLAPPGDDDLSTGLQKLATFLSPKKKLRCLDWSEPWGSIEALSPLLDVLRSLPRLEVLGIDLTCDDDDASEMLKTGMLNQYIPKSLTTLRLWIDYFDSRPPISNSLNELVGQIRCE